MSCFSLGEFIQINGTRSLCFNDAAVFICTNSEYAFIIWDIRLNTGLNYGTSFTSNDPEGRTESATVHNSPITFNVTYNNGSSLSATLTIERPVNLNGTRISCRGKTLQLNVVFRDTS